MISTSTTPYPSSPFPPQFQSRRILPRPSHLKPVRKIIFSLLYHLHFHAFCIALACAKDSEDLNNLSSFIHSL